VKSQHASVVTRFIHAIIPLFLVTFSACTSVHAADKAKRPKAPPSSKGWAQDFGVEKKTLASSGRTRYFVLEPGFQLVLEGKSDKVIITVLDETKQIGKVTTRVVEEREEKKGKVVEISKNYFAICKNTGDVFYFGEDVDIYSKGKVVKHSGAWHAYEKNFRPGMMMPGAASVGARYYQEIAPGKALDRAEIVSITETFKTPAGTFKNCLKTKETSGLDPRERCFKTYAPGIGLIQDEHLLLTKYGFIKK